MNENILSYNNNENPTNKLYDHFKTLHSAPDPNTLSAFQIHMLNDKKRLEDSNHLQSELDNPISIEEIDKAIKKLKNKKAAGLDGIRNEMIKTSSRFIKYPLEKLLNLILQYGIFPRSWSNGIITALHKSGNKDDPSNYRGICISSCLGKVFCSILNTRLLNFSNNHKILHRSQIGFLPGHCASEHIFSLRTLIDQHVTHSSRGKLYTCFVDFKKAFDSIWHQGLLYKLLKYNIGGTFYKIIFSTYSHSICCVKDNYTRSKCFNYDKGVRQGCILSPLLFNLYLNELPFILNNNAKDSILLPDGSRRFSLKLSTLRR